MRLDSMCLATLMMAAPVCASDATCTTVFDANKKVITTPAHIYSTTAPAGHPDQVRQSEVIYSGGVNGAIFVKVNGRWTHSTMKPAQMLEQEDENIRNSKSACRYLRDESVNGEAAAVYSIHSDTDGMIGESMVWIAKARGLPLKVEGDTDIGDGPEGKSHLSTRYDYSNVRPPDGVK